MTTVNDFQLFYTNLVLNGIMVELLAKYVESSVSLENDIDFWNKQFEELAVKFQDQQKERDDRFKNLLKEDMEKAGEAEKLLVNNTERYNWLWNEVLYSKSDMSGAFFSYLLLV